jgi:hypothetical protein
MICDALSLPFHHPAETYSTSENLYADLGIPAEAGSTLPCADRVRAGLDAEEVEDLGETGAGRGAARSRGRARTARGGDRQAEAAPEGDSTGPGEQRPRRSRSRRRTRAGRPLDAEAAGATGGEDGGATGGEDAEGGSDPVETEPVTAAELAGAVATVEATPRRRRRRSGRGRSRGDGSSGSGSAEPGDRDAESA